MKKAVGYIRVSDMKQVREGFSLEIQEKRIRKYCEDNKIELLKIYADRGISGRETKSRKELNMMIDELKTGTMVIFTTLSRLARNSEDGMNLVKSILAKRCYKIFELDKNREVDIYSAEGKLIFTMDNGVNEYQSTQQAEKISEIMRQMSKEGKLKKKPQFGYKNVGKKLPFEKDEEEQACIERIKDILSKSPRISLTGMCKILDQENWKCRNAQKWYTAQLKRIIKQIYDREKEDDDKKMNSRSEDKKDGETVTL